MTTDAMGLQQSLERKFKNYSRIYRSYSPFGDLIKYNGKNDFHIYQSYPQSHTVFVPYFAPLICVSSLM